MPCCSEAVGDVTGQDPGHGHVGDRAQVGGCEWLLDAQGAQAFQDACVRKGGNFFSGALACLAHENTGQQQFRAIAPFHTRTDPQWAQSVGWYVGLAPVGFAVRGTDAFREVMAEAGLALKRARPLATVPLPRITELLGMPLEPRFHGGGQGSVATLRDTTELRALAGRAEVARERLRLLYEAGVRIGTTLDVVRTAQELAEVVAPRFADVVTVDLQNPVLEGDEPTGPSPEMRRTAVHGIKGAWPLFPVGELIHFVPSNPVALSVQSGHPVLAADLAASHDWRAQDPERARRILESGLHSLITAPLQARGAVLPARPSDDIALLVAQSRLLDPSQVAEWDVPGDPALVAGIRADVTHRLEEWGMEELTFSTELVISELVTNAIRYGTDPIGLRLLRDRSVLICEVADGSSTSPHLRRAAATDEGGRGLFLVAQFTQRWGTRYMPRGKVIWTEQSLHSPAPEPDLDMADALLEQWGDAD
ncbi:SL659 acyltransferase papA1 [Streptomyces sp. MA5143a]|nr:SL659 acyltransferase papA1 [Streptomyces sp. MA5143a]